MVGGKKAVDSGDGPQYAIVRLPSGGVLAEPSDVHLLVGREAERGQTIFGLKIVVPRNPLNGVRRLKPEKTRLTIPLGATVKRLRPTEGPLHKEVYHLLFRWDWPTLEAPVTAFPLIRMLAGNACQGCEGCGGCRG
jgi:hypothetical protein